MRWDVQQCGMCDQQRLRSACACAQSDQSLCLSLEYSMIVKLLTEHYVEFLSWQGGCTGTSETTNVKMPHCWKSHATAQMLIKTLTHRSLPSTWIICQSCHRCSSFISIEAGSYRSRKHMTYLCKQSLLYRQKWNPNPCLEVIKLEFSLKLKIKRKDWLLADTCPQAANPCALFWVWDWTQVL